MKWLLEMNHCNSDGSIIMAELQRLPCTSTLTIYEPLLAHRSECSKVLIVCSGVHTHPIPIPARTLSAISTKLVKFLMELEDLPNLTPRRLLGSDATKFLLRKELPHLQNPTFPDLHPSLGNLDHLQVYIQYAILSVYPHGTGWEGLFPIPYCYSINSPIFQVYFT